MRGKCIVYAIESLLMRFVRRSAGQIGDSDTSAPSGQFIGAKSSDLHAGNRSSGALTNVRGEWVGVGMYEADVASYGASVA